MTNTKKRTGLRLFLPLLCALPGAIAAILGLVLPYADQVTKNPIADAVVRETRTLSEWATQHEGRIEISGEGYAHFAAARGFAWAIAIAAVATFLLLLYSRFDRSKGTLWCSAGAGAILVLLSIVAFLFAVFFSVSAGNESTRVLLSAAPYCTLAGGIAVGAVSFFAVRSDL